MADTTNIAKENTTLGNDPSVAGDEQALSPEISALVNSLTSHITESERLGDNADGELAAHSNFEDASQLKGTLADLHLAINTGNYAQIASVANNVNHVVSHAITEADTDKETRRLKAIVTAAIVASAYAAEATASIGGMDVFNPLMSAEEAQEFATKYLSNFQETHAAETADYLERSGFADSLSENQQNYLKTPDAATVTFSLEEQLNTAIEGASGERRALLEEMQVTIVSNQRLADDATQTSLIGSEAYNKALDKALDDNPDLVAAAGSREAAKALMQTDHNKIDDSPTVSASIEKYTDIIQNHTAQLDAETDPEERADLEAIIAVNQASLEKAEELLPFVDAFTDAGTVVKQEAAEALTARYAAMGILEKDFSELSDDELKAINERLDHENSQLSEKTTQDAGTTLISTGVTVSDEAEKVATSSTGTAEEQATAAVGGTDFSVPEENVAQANITEIRLNGVQESTARELPNNAAAEKTLQEAVLDAKNATNIILPDDLSGAVAAARQQQEISPDSPSRAQ